MTESDRAREDGDPWTEIEQLRREAKSMRNYIEMTDRWRDELIKWAHEVLEVKGFEG